MADESRLGVANWSGHSYVEEHIERALTYERSALKSAVEGYGDLIESPLEAAFIVWWCAMQAPGADLYVVLAQRHVTAGRRRCRVDFVIEHKDTPTHEVPRLLLAVELDGYEYHERTKSQVKLRDARDRALQANGWTVLHFSGSEFHQDPEGCVREVLARATERHGVVSRRGTSEPRTALKPLPLIGTVPARLNPALAAPPREHRNCLSPCGRICYPLQLAMEHARALGGDPDIAISRVEKFRDEVLADIPADRVIGDPPYQFWRAWWRSKFPSAVPR